MRLLEGLPAPQAAALAGALALRDHGSTNRFTIYAGVLSWLAAIAETAPVLAVIDDIQWLDAPSREGLLFAARRLGDAERIAMLLAGRAETGWAAPSGVPSIVLEGVDAAAGRALLARQPRAMSAAVRDRLL